MKRRFTTTKRFNAYIKQCKQYLEQFKAIQSLQEKPIPEFTQEQKWDGIALSETYRIEAENSKNKTTYELVQKEIEKGKKNLATLMTLSSNKKFIFYNSIPTINWGEVSLKEYTRYLNIGLAIINQDLTKI
jgi:hypothetical protein